MWLGAAARIYGEGDATAVLIVGPPDDPHALAVLGRKKSGGYRLLGGIDTGESIECLWRDPSALDALVSGIVGLRRPIDFGHYPTLSGLSGRLRRAAGWRGIVLSKALGPRAMPVLPLDETWCMPLDRLGRSRRQSLRRKRRKADDIGAVATHVTAPSPAEVDDLIDRFAAVEAQSWKARAGTALRHDQAQLAVFRDFCRRMAERGELRLCFLTIGEKDAAAEIAVIWENRFWSIKLGYDERFANVSPGELLRIELLAYAARQHLEAFEFCGKEAPWTAAWTDQAQQIEALRYYPATLGGFACLMRDTICLGAKRLRSGRRNG
jgi:hypothetical protein